MNSTRRQNLNTKKKKQKKHKKPNAFTNLRFSAMNFLRILTVWPLPKPHEAVVGAKEQTPEDTMRKKICKHVPELISPGT